MRFRAYPRLEATVAVPGGPACSIVTHDLEQLAEFIRGQAKRIVDDVVEDVGAQGGASAATIAFRLSPVSLKEVGR